MKLSWVMGFYGRNAALVAGKRAELMIHELAKQRQYKIVKAKQYFDIHHHWDYELDMDTGVVREGSAEAVGSPKIADLTSFKIDVKSMKKISRTDLEPQDEWVWLEVHGVGEKNEGWLYGGKADFIVFETKSSFVFILRTDLIKVVEERVDRSPESLVKKAGLARYKLYSRPNRHDLITLVEYSVLKPYIKETWNKPDYMISQPITCKHYTSNLSMDHIRRYRKALKISSLRVRTQQFKKIKGSIRRYKYCPMCKSDLIEKIEGLDDTRGEDLGLGIYIKNNRHLLIDT